MSKITDGMRFRMFTRVMQSTDDGIDASSPDVLRAELDARITALMTSDVEAYKEIVGKGFGKSDWEHPVEVDPWDLFNFNTYFNWSQRTIGFGQYSISVKREGDEVVVSASTESMSVEWQRQALHGLVDGLFAHIPEELDIESLPEGNFRIKVPAEVLAHEKKLARAMSGEDQQDGDGNGTATHNGE